MRIVILLYSFFLIGDSFAQAPTILQWQKNYGGSHYDYVADLKILSDGNIIMFGSSNSNDGDINGHHGSTDSTDICIIKISPAGNILWQKSYGGTASEEPSRIIQTNDGGLLFLGSTRSTDGDVSGHHGVDGSMDVWVVKLDASGNVIWQKCYGGFRNDKGYDILETSGGFIITAETNSLDGDVSGNHGTNILFNDLWVFKIDLAGNLLWQRCYGGTRNETGGPIQQTLDGAFIIASKTNSRDGDVSTMPQGMYDAWILKISPTGAIIWDKCIGGNDIDVFNKIIVNSDGSFFMAGLITSTDLPGSFPRFFPIPGNPASDGWVVMLDAGGNILWQKAFGGTNSDGIYDAVKTPDGGYLLCGFTRSNDGIVCQKHLLDDVWLVNMNMAGNIEWNRTYGGTKFELGVSIALTPVGDCYVYSESFSSDGDVTANKGLFDWWLSRYSFTGVLISPSITISASKDSIRCPGETVQFFATTVNGGTSPAYQWKLNGTNIGGNSSTISISNIFQNDAVTCVLTSNSPCVDIKTAGSNSIKIKIGQPNLQPFLPNDTALCSYQKIELKTNRKFTSYSWSNGSTEESITVKQPGTYWLYVVDRLQCIGRDSIVILPKPCIEGVFIPNSFTPNRDGKNDVFRPIMNADVIQYRFIVYDRWGHIVFQTTTLNKGWDGTIKDTPYDTGVFVWQIFYQLEGEEPTSKRGTVLLIR